MTDTSSPSCEVYCQDVATNIKTAYLYLLTKLVLQHAAPQLGGPAPFPLYERMLTRFQWAQ